MNDQDNASRVLAGKVKWFDPTRGFGFVVSEAVDNDILLHANVVRNFGQSSVVEGSAIELEVIENTRGWQATAILSLEAPAVAPSTEGEIPEYMQEIPDDVPYEPARVKWFDKVKGFGFANVFGSNDDIFIHAEVLRKFGLADLGPGEAICLRATEGKRGRLAVEVRRWEYITSL